MKVLVINGPNLNMLGVREPDLYGKRDYSALVGFVEKEATRRGIHADCFQSNSEGEIVTEIQNALGTYDAIVINAAAYTHTSVAILDALKAVGLPTVEVHLTSPTYPRARNSGVSVTFPCTQTKPYAEKVSTVTRKPLTYSSRSLRNNGDGRTLRTPFCTHDPFCTG